jgi:hypothetical protein
LYQLKKKSPACHSWLSFSQFLVTHKCSSRSKTFKYSREAPRRRRRRPYTALRVPVFDGNIFNFVKRFLFLYYSPLLLVVGCIPPCSQSTFIGTIK